ncbi:DUF302 domain-containing protein [Poseidonibacter sp. 1_MG-2023]|uniref:DUF302 domain-containing protein n=1 Tax=Poseidonibacter TaxID=2321187 RepID=UPI001C0A258A|nr:MULTISPECIES: DUF302 domain-containing protein [Poseidonibacter]MDO6827458.1 DUF302 domain-containing protein [Poseidonibacter sp. 1_MG-2023]
MRVFILFFIFVIFSLNLQAQYKKTIHSDYVIYEVQGRYSTIMFTLSDEISQNGFISSYKADIGNAVKNISSFYKKEPIFKNAQKIGFCRQTLTLEMMEENPNNLMFCPLSIALYELNNEKNLVKIVYRFAKVSNKESKVLEKVNKEILQLIENSLE